MQRTRFWWIVAAIVAVVAATCVYTLFALQYRFGGYDLSPLIDSGWRVVSGQVPNRDFICTFPPLLYLPVAVGFKVFGVRWFSLTLLSVVVPFVVTLFGLRILTLLRGTLTDRTVLGLAAIYATALLLPLLMVGHIWHSSWTQMFAVYAFLASFALIRGSAKPRATQFEWLAHLCVAETALLLAKPNTALPALLFCTLALVQARLARQALWALAAALLLGSAALLAVHTSLWATAKAYGELSSRFIPVNYFDGILINPDPLSGLKNLIVFLPALPMLLWLLVVIVRHPKSGAAGAVDVLALGAAVVTLLGWGTNVEFRLTDVPALLFGTALLGTTGRGHAKWLTSAYGMALYTFLLLGIFYSATRGRMQAVGLWGSNECGYFTVEQHDPFFGDFNGCAPFFSLLAETDQVVHAHPGAHFFFGPRMEFLYAREHMASPRGLPLWWHPGSSFPFRDVPAIVTAFQQDKPDVLIFLKGDRTRMPSELLQVIDREYAPAVAPLVRVAPETDVPATGQLDVLVRRPAA